MQWQLLSPHLQAFANTCSARIHQHRRTRTVRQPCVYKPSMKKLLRQPGQLLQQTACADGCHLTRLIGCLIGCGAGSCFSQRHRFHSILRQLVIALPRAIPLDLLRIRLQSIKGCHIVVDVVRVLGIAFRWLGPLGVGSGVPLLQRQGFDHRQQSHTGAQRPRLPLWPARQGIHHRKVVARGTQQIFPQAMVIC